jgi:CRISPR-associated protein Cas1
LNEKKRIEIARKFIDAASYNMLKNLQYYNRRGKDLEPIIEIIKLLQAKMQTSEKIPELMGYEGNIRKNYYDAFNLIINDFVMGTRTMQPPTNEVNSLISFGNMMCYSECLRSIHQTQLEPTLSFLHEPGERRFSLSLDLAEVFKPILVDRVIFKVLNKNMLKKEDFDFKLNYVHIKDKAKQVFIQAFEERLGETIMHKSLERKVSYKRLIKLECYKLQKDLLGIEEYVPLKIWW